MEIETRITDPRIGNDFPLPDYATDGSAGKDLCACLDKPINIAPAETAVIGTGIAIFINNPDYMAFMAPRSGLGVKHGIVLANTVGIIDSDYQDEIKAVLYNRGQKPYVIQPGERICQLIIMPVARATLKIVEQFSAASKRGAGGFGSSGRF